jgi:hypothetical protein
MADEFVNSLTEIQGDVGQMLFLRVDCFAAYFYWQDGTFGWEFLRPLNPISPDFDGESIELQVFYINDTPIMSKNSIRNILLYISQNKCPYFTDWNIGITLHCCLAEHWINIGSLQALHTEDPYQL